MTRRRSDELRERKNVFRGRFVWICGRRQHQNVGGDAHIAPPISFPQIFRYVAGRIISAPTFTHTFSKRPGRRGRRPLHSFRQMMSDHPGGRGRPPLQFIRAYDFQTAGRIISAPTFRIRFANGRDVEDNLPYNSFRQMMSEWPGGRGRPPLQIAARNVVQITGRKSLKKPLSP